MLLQQARSTTELVVVLGHTVGDVAQVGRAWHSPFRHRPSPLHGVSSGWPWHGLFCFFLLPRRRLAALCWLPRTATEPSPKAAAASTRSASRRVLVSLSVLVMSSNRVVAIAAFSLLCCVLRDIPG